MSKLTKIICSKTVPTMIYYFDKKGKQENVPPTSKVPVKERLGGGHPQKVLTQSQVPVILDEAAVKEATEAREKEREKVPLSTSSHRMYQCFNSFRLVFHYSRQLLPSKRVRKFSPPKKR